VVKIERDGERRCLKDFDDFDEEFFQYLNKNLPVLRV
jgi:hypothetical protein